MYFRIFIIIVIAIALYMLARWFIDTPPQQVTKRLKQSGLYIIAGVFIVLALTGKLHWLFALIAGLVPFAQRLFALFRSYQVFKNIAGQFKTRPGTGGASAGGQQSTIATAWLKMTLHHDSGDLSGMVLQGRYRGKQLEEMAIAELITLLADCRTQDEESATLLETYMDRRFGEQWRTQFDHEAASQQSSPANVSVNEAYEILGLSRDATAEEIKTAHKRLIQKLHPDRGGSSYLAAKINMAKDVLMAHVGHG